MANRWRRPLLTLAVGLALTGAASAGGPATVTWRQDTDCPDVGGWELLVAPITTQQPDPTPLSASLGASIANAPPLACGAALSTVVPLAGGGRRRLWLVALGRDGASRSPVSNGIDEDFPLAAPALVGVEF